MLQELRAHNEARGLGYELSYWHTRQRDEVDFVLYGERGLHAFEVKLTSTFRPADLAGLRAFRDEYPVAKCRLLYGGERAYEVDGFEVLPVAEALPKLGALLGG